jgi:hypothetical protein
LKKRVTVDTGTRILSSARIIVQLYFFAERVQIFSGFGQHACILMIIIIICKVFMDAILRNMANAYEGYFLSHYTGSYGVINSMQG